MFFVTAVVKGRSFFLVRGAVGLFHIFTEDADWIRSLESSFAVAADRRGTVLASAQKRFSPVKLQASCCEPTVGAFRPQKLLDIRPRGSEGCVGAAPINKLPPSAGPFLKDL